MTKAGIRKLVAGELSQRGYGCGLYGWPRAGRLHVMHKGQTVEFRIPSGTSKKNAIELLAWLPSIGPEKPMRIEVRGARDDYRIQIDAGEFWEGRR